MFVVEAEPHRHRRTVTVESWMKIDPSQNYTRRRLNIHARDPALGRQRVHMRPVEEENAELHADALVNAELLGHIIYAKLEEVATGGATQQ